MIKPMENLEYLFSEENLRESWRNVAMRKTASGIDDLSVDTFAINTTDRLRTLHDSIVDDTYSPQPLIVFQKEKNNGGFRELTIPTITDKIVAKTAADFEVRKFNYDLEPQSYAYRPHRSALKAVSAVEKALKSGSITHVARIDIENFFDSMNHSILENMLLQFGNPAEMADLIMRFARNPRFDGVRLSVPEAGVPQGSPIAPVLSNLYLDHFDKEMNKNGVSFLRYADDTLIFAESAEEAGNNMNLAITTLKSLDLKISIDKTRIYSVASGFVFLGFLFTPEGKTPCGESRDNLSRKLSAPKYDDETDTEYDKRLKSVLRGWNNYFHADTETLEDNPKDDSVPSTSSAPNEAAPKSEERSPIGRGFLKGIGVDVDDPRNNAPDSESLKEDDALLAVETMTRVEELVAEGRFAKATGAIRSALSGEHRFDDSTVKSFYAKLAEIYESQGLLGSAERCREMSGAGKAKSKYKKSDEVVWGTDDPENWIDVFDSGSPVFRQYVDSVGRGGYKPASRSLNPAYIRDHWLGKHTLATSVYDKNNRVKFAVMDLDVSRRELDESTKSEIDELKIRLLDDARGLLSIAEKAGVRGVIEESGQKGYHVWFFLYQRQKAALAKDFLMALDRMAGTPPEGTHRELFPASDELGDDKLSSRIKMPLGLHRVSGNYSRFILPDGTPVKNPIHLLSQHTTFNKKRSMIEAIRSWNEFISIKKSSKTTTPAPNAPNSGKAERVFESCAVLNALRSKAKSDHRLTHAERAVLRGILAPLGAEGRDAIHAVLRECDNYSRNLTDKMLAATHSNPMGCARIKEILSYMTQKIGCDCSFRKKQGDYAHPLRHLSKVQTKRSDTSEPAPKVFTRRKSTSDNQNQSRVAEAAEIPSDLADGEVHTSADGTPKEKRTIARLKLVLGSFSIDLNFSRKKRESK